MLSLFKKSASNQNESTFKARVGSFWQWYGKVAPRFYEMIESHQGESLAEEVSKKIDSLLPGMAWVFGPGDGGVGHSFTLSGEGILHRQLLTLFWHSRAPAISGWTFYSARQPGDISQMRLNIGGISFDPRELWLTPSLDQERQKIDIIAWHPLFTNLVEKDPMKVLFLLLDEVLGEYGTEQWIGEIAIGKEKFGDAIPISELLEFVKGIESSSGWKKLPPGEAFFGYQMKPHERFFRGDIITGMTMHPRLLEEYIASNGELSDPLASMGADYIFVSIRADFLPKGKQVEYRSAIQDALDLELKAKSSGRLIGGAHGLQNAYIDLMIFDGLESVNIVKRVLKEQKLPAGTAIHYFAKEKRGHRILFNFAKNT